MRIAICDDEEKCISDVEKHLESYAKDHGLVFDIFKYVSSSEILKSSKHFDIAFLDIEMSGMNGIEIGRELQKINPQTVLIYVTAYNHYLDDALDLGITRFFDKPIDSRRFNEGMDRAVSKVDNTEVPLYLDEEGKEYFSVRSKDIIFAEISVRKTKIVTTSGEFLSSKNIKFWKDHLNKSYFEVPHKSYIININFISYYCRDYVILAEKYTVPIAYGKRTEFKRRFMKMMEG